jgi:hypothetical protein
MNYWTETNGAIDAIKKDDKITHNSNDYRVQNVINRDQGGGTVMYKTITLFLI